LVQHRRIGRLALQRLLGLPPQHPRTRVCAMHTLPSARAPAQRGRLSVAGAAACGALGTVGYGMESEGLEPLRNPRLSQALVLLKNAGHNQEDCRKLRSEDLRKGLGEGSEGRVLLANAIFVGTAQACHLGSYWAPDFGAPGAELVDCRNHVRPVSCLYRPTRMPTQGQLQANAHGRSLGIQCMAQRNPLDVAAWILSSSLEDRHVAVVRFTSTRDFRNESVRYSHATEDQIFLRTSYHQAFERMEGDLQVPIREALDDGCVICTSGVGILRGAVRDGAPWYREPKKVDVLWVSVPPHPERGVERHGHKEWYGNEADQTAMARTLDLIFAWAAARGTDALVLPPVGCGTHGCSHPSLGVASLIHDAAQRYKQWLPQVHVASDHHSHFEGSWWEDFADVLQNGKGRPDAAVVVPPIQLPPYTLVEKGTRDLFEKHQRANSSRGRPSDRQRSLGLTPRMGPRRLPIC